MDAVDGLVSILEEPNVELRALNPITVEYAAGYTTGNACPQSIRQAMLLLIGHWYQNREAVGVAGWTLPGRCAWARSAGTWTSAYPAC